jgi:hypothetical protein
MNKKICYRVLLFASVVDAVLDCFRSWWISESVSELQKSKKKMKNLYLEAYSTCIFYQKFVSN